MPEPALLTRAWRIGRTTAVTEMSGAGRIGSRAFEIAVTVALIVLLWRGLYSRQPVVAGVGLDQAVTYAVIAALLTYLRVGQRSWVRDSVIQHIRLGTAIYWFLWPVRPPGYHLIRGLGDVAYALSWAASAYAVCLLAGGISPPAGSIAGACSLAAILLGQLIFYLIGLLLDLICFWTVINERIVRVVIFVQSLLSGGFAPLWFFPDWFQTASRWLPFAGIISLPMEIYAGRARGSTIMSVLGEQLLWCLVLGAIARLVWSRALLRTDSLGGG